MRDFLVPTVYLGVKTMCKKFQKVCSLFGDLLRVTVLTTPSNLLSGNGATRIYNSKDHLILKLGDQVISLVNTDQENRKFSMDIAREICTDSFCTEG